MTAGRLIAAIHHRHGTGVAVLVALLVAALLAGAALAVYQANG